MGSGMLANLKAKCESSVEAPTRRGVTVWEVAVFVFLRPADFLLPDGTCSKEGGCILE